MRTVYTSLLMLLLMTILTGVIYPLAVTSIGEIFFPYQSNGSIIEFTGKKIGSKLIGQHFSDPKYFWGRPSATSPNPYNASASSGSNLGPSNPALFVALKDRVDVLRSKNNQNSNLVPVDLVTSSASGLEPHITPASALFQIPRIAKTRNIEEKQIKILVDRFTEERTIGILGEKRVNVLLLNLALDQVNKE